MAKKIRSEYIENLLNDKKILEQKLKDVTEDTIKNILSEKVNDHIKTMINEDDEDSFSEEEVDDTATETSPEDDNASETSVDDADMESSDDAEDDVWGELEQYKGEDGEYDLTGMDNENLIKVLKVMNPEDGVRVVRNDNGTVTLSDDETDKEYILDIDGAFGEDAECHGDDCEVENEFEIDIDDDLEESVNEGNLGYGVYQKETAMTTPSNHEPADKSKTYSMDGGVPTGTERPFAGTGDKAPFDKSVNEEDEEEIVVEVMTTAENSAANRWDAMNNSNNNEKTVDGRNRRGGRRTSTSDNAYQPGVTESIKRKANQIFMENKEMKNVLSTLQQRLEEAIVVNSSLGHIVRLVTENVTSKDEKNSIVERFQKVRTREDGNKLFNQINEELKRTERVSNVNNVINSQILESKGNTINETPMYKSPELKETIDFMTRLNKIK